MAIDPDEQAQKFAQAVGFTLHNWSMVEIQLGRLFALLSDMPDSRKAHALVDAVVSFEVRLALVNVMIASENCDDADKGIWQKVSERIRQAYKTRHSIAHFSMMGHTRKDGSEEIKFHPFLTSHKVEQRTQKSLPIEHIHAFSAKIRDEIIPSLDWFCDEARQRRGLPRERSPQVPPPIAHLRDLASRTPPGPS